MLEVWVGKVELGQLPGGDHVITLSGQGAFTWITTWANSIDTYKLRVTHVMRDYGLFPIDFDEIVPAIEMKSMADALFEQCEETKRDPNFCLYGTFHHYPMHH